jgi:hypothetical protein
MDHMMHVNQHHDNLKEQRSNQQQDAGTTSVSVSRVAFVLAAIAFISLVSSSFAAFGAWASSGAALSATTRQLLAALCGFVTTKKALFILSNVIFLFLAADCRCFFGVCTMAPSKSDGHHTASQLPPCAVQAVQPCGSYSRSPYHGSDATSTSGNCSEAQERRQVSPTQEPFMVEGDQANSVTLETVVVEEPACSGVAEELEKLEIDELNRKFEEFIQSRRIKWIKEEEQVLQCQQV